MSILINGLDMPSDDGELVEVLIFGDGHVVQTGDSFKAEDGRFYYKPCDWKYLTAVPVKHGEWIHGREVSRDYVGDACVCIHYEKWWCSECNYTVDLGEPLWHYCPNCGAKMDGEREDIDIDIDPNLDPCRGCADSDGYGGCRSQGGCAEREDDE